MHTSIINTLFIQVIHAQTFVQLRGIQSGCAFYFGRSNPEGTIGGKFEMVGP